MCTDGKDGQSESNSDLIKSSDSQHPANLLPVLCVKFWTLGWVYGTGGGASIRDGCVDQPPF